MVSKSCYLWQKGNHFVWPGHTSFVPYHIIVEKLPVPAIDGRLRYTLQKKMTGTLSLVFLFACGVPCYTRYILQLNYENDNYFILFGIILDRLWSSVQC